MILLSNADFFKVYFFKKFFQENHLSIKQFGSRSRPTFSQSWSGSKLFAKVISWWEKSPANKERANIYLQIWIQQLFYFVICWYNCNLCKQFEQDQPRQKAGPDLGLKCRAQSGSKLLTICWYSQKNLKKKWFWKKSADDKSMYNYPAC